MTASTDRILQLSDAGHPPDAIAAATGLSATTVYAALRTHRPDRPRKKRAPTSDLPYKIRVLAARGHKPARIALMCQCSRQFVYRMLQEGKTHEL